MKREDTGIPGLVTQLREELELIQRQLAQEVGVALSAINQWEKG
jgi:DNA-binding XRE family transcriptional regulator